MRNIAKGENVAIVDLTDNVSSLTVALGWSDPNGTGDADVSILLLGADRKVRSDEDFYFYNRPVAEADPVQLLGKTPTATGVEDCLVVDLTAVPDEIATVVVAASRYENASFGELADVRLALSDDSGQPILRFDIADLSVESAVVFGEFYRREGTWKFRAVGQGYQGGLAALAADFGVLVESTESESEPSEANAGAAESLESTPSKRRRTVRTTKKKLGTVMNTGRRYAEQESWASARLFPTSARNSQEQETRATSILLAVMAQVPEFGRRVAAKVNAPAGTIESFTEVIFPRGDEQVRPDGVLKIARAGRVWTALLEVKTNGNALRANQVEAYVEVARRRNYDAVVTLSNELALPGEHPVPIDGRNLRKVALRHLSWAEIVHEAHLLCHHEGLANPAHLWLLKEFLDYLRHDNSGCRGFDNMGPAWVSVREAVRVGTLHHTDKRAVRVVESWDKAVRQLCLRLGGDLGATVAPVTTRRRNGESSRRDEAVKLLAEQGQLAARIKVPGPTPVLEIVADLRVARVEASGVLPAPDAARPQTRVRRLLRQLESAPPDLRIETLLAGRHTGPRELLGKAIEDPALLVPETGSTITGFRLTLAASLGTKRGVAETGFIRSVDCLIDEMYGKVVNQLKTAPAVSQPDDSAA